MAKAHIYVRVQVSGDNEQVQAIEAAANALRSSIEAVGGDWNGSVALQLDDEPDEAVPEVAPAAGETPDAIS